MTKVMRRRHIRRDDHRARLCCWRWYNSELLHHRKVIAHRPMLGDLAIDYGEDIDIVEGYLFAGGRNAHEIAQVRAVKGLEGHHSIGRLWPPEYSSQHPVPLDVLLDALSLEHRHVRAFYEKQDAALLGRASLYIPAIGWINYIQSLQIAVFHDARHFDEIRRTLSTTLGVPGLLSNPGL